jgi:ribosome biogenesis GTPase A
MSTTVVNQVVKSLRTEFPFPNVQRINWYPGHMVKATRLMIEKLKSVDYVIEVRDTRLPLTSMNSVFEEEIRKRKKPRLLIFNKADLCDIKQIESIEKYFNEKQEQTGEKLATLFTSAKDGTNIRHIIKEALNKYPIEKKFKTLPFMFMIAGIPNVGKSSIINALRLKNRVLSESDTSTILKQNSMSMQPVVSARTTKSAKSGALPGVTRDISSFLVCLKPKCLLMDTPGVLFPSLDSHEQAFKLALINALPDQLLSVSAETLIDFLLYTLNRKQQFDYVKILNLPGPIDDINEVLEEYVCPKMGAIGSNGVPDKQKASLRLLKMFREGKLGKIVLDDI